MRTTNGDETDFRIDETSIYAHGDSDVDDVSGSDENMKILCEIGS